MKYSKERRERKLVKEREIIIIDEWQGEERENRIKSGREKRAVKEGEIYEVDRKGWQVKKREEIVSGEERGMTRGGEKWTPHKRE